MAPEPGVGHCRRRKHDARFGSPIIEPPMTELPVILPPRPRGRRQ
jgi:hypothetical protein